jgi:hypothetical protein
MLEMEWRGLPSPSLPSPGFSTIVDLISHPKKSYACFHTTYIRQEKQGAGNSG